jgi:hypothetical protein
MLTTKRLRAALVAATATVLALALTAPASATSSRAKHARGSPIWGRCGWVNVCGSVPLGPSSKVNPT